MTRGAWIMLVATWAVVIFLAGRFFLRVVRTPRSASDGEDSDRQE